MNFPSIPGYEIESLAGRGGMGAVYRARQIATGRQVALKLLTARAPNETSLAAFRREAELIAGLEHPHILPVYDFGEADGLPYLVMRHLGGGSLSDKIKEGPASLAMTNRWLERLADALDFAHQQGIVHKDVKPSNALLDEAGQIYLTDFGIAGTMETEGEGVPLGSAAYMSPEQCRGQTVDARADVYALTVMLFELLTGQKPYIAETALGVMSRQIHDPIPSARALNPAIPPAVEALIMRGMAKDPANRPASAAAFARELAEAIAAPPPSAVAQPGTAVAPPTVGPTVGPTAAKSGRSRLWWVIVGLLGLLVCLAGALAVGGGGLLLATAETPTPIPTATRVPRPETPTPTPPPTGQLLRDDFSQPAGGFATYSDEDGGVVYEEERLLFTALTRGVEWFSFSGRVTATDLMMSVTAVPLSDNPAGYLGLICRWQDVDNYTLLALNGAGEAAIWQKQNGATVILADWRPTAVGLTVEEPIVMQAVCEGGQLRLSANERLLVEAEDPAPISGDVALMIGLQEAGVWQALFDDLLVVEP
jgi:tRNA A-37 threonylcarbamoyl transferase component Bud32